MDESGKIIVEEGLPELSEAIKTAPDEDFTNEEYKLARILSLGEIVALLGRPVKESRSPCFRS